MKILKLPFKPGKSIAMIKLIKERLVRYSNVLKSNKNLKEYDYENIL